jgi:carbamoyltransferase
MENREIILGIGGYTTEASACLLIDGKLVMALEEERFTRIKHHGGWPRNAIARLLREHELKENNITHISFSYNPWLRLSRRIPYRLLHLPARPVLSTMIIINEIRFVAEFMMRLKQLRQRSGAKLFYVRHHLAHAASAFYTSPYPEAAFYTVDQRGEWDTTLWGICKDKNLTVLGNTGYPNSLGIFYAGVTQHLGFASNDEYKVMGLASYGDPSYVDDMRKVLFPVGENQFKLDTSYLQYHKTRGMLGGSFFSQKFNDLFGPPRGEEEPVTQQHMDLAASAQRVFEECVVHQINSLHRQNPSDNLCIAGGCALNGVMTGKLYTETPFKHVFQPSVSSDNGLSMGGALFVRHQVLGHERGRPLLRADLGTEYDDEEIRRILDLFKLEYRRYDDIVPITVDLLVEGKIVGWFQGRMEYGARALGYRSILANPTQAGMKDDINKYVKFREEFRPFAPSVLLEKADEFFEIPGPVPFMTSVCKVREQGIRKLPATTHVDDTARVQTVDREEAPLYWRLIDEFGRKSGVPVVLNTSFNVMGEPLVEHPRHAIRCFFSTGMDALAVGSFVLTKPGR